MFGIVDRPVEQGLGVSLNGRERRPQFMGHVDDEIFAHTFEFLQFGVLMLQLLEHPLELLARVVELLHQNAEFISPSTLEASFNSPRARRPAYSMMAASFEET